MVPRISQDACKLVRTPGYKKKVAYKEQGEDVRSEATSTEQRW